MQMRVVQRALAEEAKLAAAEASTHGCMEPIEGISLETYAALESRLAAIGAVMTSATVSPAVHVRISRIACKTRAAEPGHLCLTASTGRTRCRRNP